MKKILLFLVLMVSSYPMFAQESIKADSLDSSKELLFFSNDGCGKCAATKSYLDKHQMPYHKIPIKENRSLMYEYVHKKTGGKNVGVGYPLLVYKDHIYFSIKDLTTTLKEIEKMMIVDGILKQGNDQQHKGSKK